MPVNVITRNQQSLFQLPINNVITRSDNNCSAVITQRGACVITRSYSNSYRFTLSSMGAAVITRNVIFRNFEPPCLLFPYNCHVFPSTIH